MTIICYRDGVMAADTASVSNGLRMATVRKITRCDNGGLFAGAGTSVDCRLVSEWVRAGFLPEHKPDLTRTDDGDFGGIYVAPDGVVYRLQVNLIPIESPAEFHADGYNLEFATGAMAAGASAERAVELTIQYGQNVGGPIQVEHLNPRPAEVAV